MELAEIAKALMEHAAGAKPADGGNDIEARLSQLAESVKTAIDGNMQMLDICKTALDDMDKRINDVCNKLDAFTGAWDGLAKEKDRSDGIEGLKSKYSVHEEYGPIASAYSEAEGSEIWEPLHATLEKAREEAASAGGDTPFDEDGYVGNIFKSTKDYMGKIAEAHGKAGKPVAAEVTVAAEEPKTTDEMKSEPIDEMTDEETAAKEGAKIGARARERLYPRGKK